MERGTHPLASLLVSKGDKLKLAGTPSLVRGLSASNELSDTIDVFACRKIRSFLCR